MLGFDSRSLAVGSVGLVLVFLLTLPALKQFVAHFREPKPKPRIYEDKDGIATEESTAKYSTTIPKILLAIFTILGLLTAIGLAVLGTVNYDQDPMYIENWINFAQWVCTLKIWPIFC